MGFLAEISSRIFKPSREKSLEGHTSRASAKKAGAVRYFTGRPCKRGHISLRFSSTGQCIDCLNEARRAWRLENREKWLAHVSALRALDPQKYRDREAVWRSKESSKAIKARLQRERRARQRSAEGVHSAHEIAEILKLQGSKCAYCRKPVRKYEVDHIVPLAKGGSNDRRNLQITCAPCNRRKRTKDPIRFSQELGRLL